MPRRQRMTLAPTLEPSVTTGQASISKGDKLRNLLVVLFVEALIFLAPTEGRVEGVAASYWDGVRLRLSSGKFWLLALVSGIVVALVLAGFAIVARYMARFVTPRSEDAKAADNSLKKT